MNASEMTKKITANILHKSENTEQAQEEQNMKDIHRKEQQQQALNEAVTSNRILRASIERPRRTREQRLSDTLASALNELYSAPSGSSNAVSSWAKLIDIIDRLPKRETFDTILKFFIAHRKDEFLHQMNALQGIEVLTQENNLKVRVLYETMRNLASGQANDRNLSVRLLRSIFKQDAFPDWVSVKLTEYSRYVKR